MIRDGVAQLVENVRLELQRPQGLNPVKSTRKNGESLSESKMLCWLIVGVPNPRACIRMIMYDVKDPVVHVSFYFFYFLLLA